MEEKKEWDSSPLKPTCFVLAPQNVSFLTQSPLKKKKLKGHKTTTHPPQKNGSLGSQGYVGLGGSGPQHWEESK